MKSLRHLLNNNKEWAAGMKAADQTFFEKLSKQQSPKYLWIGCSDSRVPANQIVGLQPGEIFVHRNVGNLVVHTDFNCLSVVQYAAAILKVEHIIVCGHYGCGGVAAAFGNTQLGLIDNWLRHIKDVANKYADTLKSIRSEEARHNRLCELNVIEQVNNICHTTMVQEVWNSGQNLTVHGWIYGIGNGLLKDLRISVRKADEIKDIYRVAYPHCANEQGDEPCADEAK